MKNNGIKSYLIGFVLSVLLTLAAYFAVTKYLLTGEILTAAILGLALLQLVVQLVFFLHLINESRPRWKLVVFLSTISIILIVMLGSLWIMDNLDYHMTPKDVDKYIMNEEGIHK